MYCGEPLTFFHLYSDKSLAILAKHIKTELLPTQNEDEDTNDGRTADISTSLPLLAVESAIKSVLERNNYGIDATSDTGKLPAGLCIWRWEAKKEYRDWLPKAARERADGRHAERVEVSYCLNNISATSNLVVMQAKKHLAIVFDAFSQAERDAILNPKGPTKLPTKDANKTVEATNVSPANVDLKESLQQRKKHQKTKENDSENDQVCWAFTR